MIYIFNRVQYGLKNFDSGDRNFELDFSVKKPSLPYVTTKINHRMKKIWTSFKNGAKNKRQKGLSMFIFLHIIYKVEKMIVYREPVFLAWQV